MKKKNNKNLLIGIIVFWVLFSITSNKTNTDNNSPSTTESITTQSITTEATTTEAAPEESKPEFSMYSDDDIGATKHTLVGAENVEPSGTYKIVCTKGHGCLNINDEELFVFAVDEYKGTEYSGLTYTEEMTIELKGSDALLSRAFNSSEFKLEFYLVN